MNAILQWHSFVQYIDLSLSIYGWQRQFKSAWDVPELARTAKAMAFERSGGFAAAADMILRARQASLAFRQMKSLVSRVPEARQENVQALEELLTFRLSVLSRRLDHQAATLLAGTSLTLTAYRMLVVIEAFGEISISDISRFCAIGRAQIGRTAADLERRGLVEFRSDGGNRRKKLVVAKKAGLEILERINPAFGDRSRALDECLGEERRKALMDSLNRLSELFPR